MQNYVLHSLHVQTSDAMSAEISQATKSFESKFSQEKELRVPRSAKRGKKTGRVNPCSNPAEQSLVRTRKLAPEKPSASTAWSRSRSWIFDLLRNFGTTRSHPPLVTLLTIRCWCFRRETFFRPDRTNQYFGPFLGRPPCCAARTSRVSLISLICRTHACDGVLIIMIFIIYWFLKPDFASRQNYVKIIDNCYQNGSKP